MGSPGPQSSACRPFKGPEAEAGCVDLHGRRPASLAIDVMEMLARFATRGHILDSETVSGWKVVAGSCVRRSQSVSGATPSSRLFAVYQPGQAW
jgi:hypothetical protein